MRFVAPSAKANCRILATARAARRCARDRQQREPAGHAASASRFPVWQGLRSIFLAKFIWFLVIAVGIPEALSGAEREILLRNSEIQRRSTNEFLAADFFKPVEPADAGLPFKLAPLIIQEVNSVEGPGSSNDQGGGAIKDKPGRVQEPFVGLLSSNGPALFDGLTPTMYTSSDVAVIHGKPLPRFTYVWFYPAAQTPAHDKSMLPAQGVRITLNPAGEPVIWEVLADPDSVELVFVAQSLERAALAEFGKPLPGRRYAVECGLEEAPNVIVARVIEDGPMAMGPIIYLSTHTRAVSTLICRCMPAQAKKLLATATYELRSGDVDADRLLLARARSQVRFEPAFWPGDPRTERRLEKCLRFPSRF